MTLERLEDLTVGYFGITKEALRSDSRKHEVMIPRTCFRAVAHIEYNYSTPAIGEFHGDNASGVWNSCNNIENGQFKKEYDGFLSYVRLNENDGEDVVVDEKTGIERITNDVFDERFYRHPEKVNSRTGNNYFPAYHFLMNLGAPESAGLSEWKKSKGHFADVILERSAEIGSAVHEFVDRMIKLDIEVRHDDINKMFQNKKEAHRVKECLLGFLNFMEEEKPMILSSESMHVGLDFGFTMDLKCALKSEDYAHTWVIDWKTSSSATDEHKMQVEVIRRTVGADKAAIVVLGNKTKKKYTFSPVGTDKDILYEKFLAIKEVAYVEIKDKKLIQPRQDNMPKEFSLRHLKLIKKI